MQFKKLSLLFSFLSLPFFLFSQINSKEINFRSPVDIPIYLSGNFGEIRSTHFHSGIDIKTQGTIGKKVYSVEEGYISRIKVSVNSYGKTIYINHPNGYTSVYGHLNNFNSKIEKIAKSIQYQDQEFEIDFYPKKDEIKVPKGEIIGYSGNTGSSEGPHLHFEIRETNEQIPVNPLFFNFDIKDDIPPVLYNLIIYPLDSKTTIDGLNKITQFNLKKIDSKYSTVDTNEIKINGHVGFGIEMNDYLNGSSNRCGIYKLSVYKNNQLYYDHTIDKFSFSEASYVRSHIDYAQKLKSKQTIQKTFISPNNNLSIYTFSKNRGIFNFSYDSLYQIRILASDAYGNKSEISFNIIGDQENISNDTAMIHNGILMNWDDENNYENEEVKVTIPKGTLFDTILKHIQIYIIYIIHIHLY